MSDFDPNPNPNPPPPGGTPPPPPGLPPQPPAPDMSTLPPGYQQAAPGYQQPPPPGYQQYAAPNPNGLPPGVAITNPGARLGAYLLEFVLAIVTLGIGWLIWAAILAGNGQTPAKKILGQRVVMANGSGPCSFARMLFMRGLLAGIVVQIAVVFTLGIILFMPFWDKKNQNLWDKISETLVVDDPINAWRVS